MEKAELHRILNSPPETWADCPHDRQQRSDAYREASAIIEKHQGVIDDLIDTRDGRDVLIEKLMRRIMNGMIGMTYQEALQDARILCVEEGWCLTCADYHDSGFCDGD